MIPQENAETNGLHTLGVQSKGFLVATKPLVVPTPRYRPGIQELHAEVRRLGEVRDLVEGTAVALRRDTWSPNRKPLHKNFSPNARA